MPEMPSLALAKSGPKAGTPQWYKAVAKEHGDTEPLKIEYRRERMSRHAIMLDKGIKTLQDAKKAVQVEGQREIDAYIALRAKTRMTFKDAYAAPDFDAETLATLERMKGELQSKVLNCEVLIYQLTGSLAQIEGLCLIVDCLSLRMLRRSKKTGKRGFYRYTAAGYLHDVGAMMSELPVLLNVAAPSNDEDEEDVDDDEVLEEEERERVRRGEDDHRKAQG